jgi:ribonuclease D
LTEKLSYRYLVDPEETRAALAVFLQQPVIGLDTETFNDFNTRQNRLSLLQLAAPSGEVLVIDGLAAGIQLAHALIEHPDVLMAAHNARFDDGVLRSEGFMPEGFVDTLRLARRTLKLQSFSLASVSQHLFGVTLDKTYQQSNWRRRPLSREQLDYAAMDAVIALRVFQTLTDRLREAGKLETELRRARLHQEPEKDFPEATFENTRAGRPFTPEERQRAELIKAWRKELAQRNRVPLYLICQDRTIEELAIQRPRNAEQLQAIHGLGPTKIGKFGAEILELLQ